MGAYRRQRKSSSSSFSIMKIFMSCCSNGGDKDMSEDDFNTRRICPSDEDGRRWIAEPGIDRKASAFIARFHESRVSDPECQTLAV